MIDEAKNHLKIIHKSENPSTISTPSETRSKSPDWKSKVVEISPSSPEVVR